MDILEEIDETIKDKKGKWNYTPMREKNETDALIDELLKEFSSDSVQDTPQAGSAKGFRNDYAGYNTRNEADERREYEQSSVKYDASLSNNKEVLNTAEKNKNNFQQNEMTQIFSRNDISDYEKEQAENTGDYREYNGSADDYYSGSGGFDDDYYDENDFNGDCENLSSEDLDLDDDEYAELENYLDAREEKIYGKKENTSVLKKIFRIVYTAVIAAFTIIGIFSSALYLTGNFNINSDSGESEPDKALKADLTKALYPIVGTYDADFDSVENLSNYNILSASFMEVVIKCDLGHYTDSETGEVIIPGEDVNQAAENIFGIKKALDFSDIHINGIDIKYDKERKGFVIPANQYVYSMYPVIIDLSEQDGIYTVTAECYNDGPVWATDKKRMPVKTAVFTLKKVEGYYRVLSAVTKG